ncbi:VTT domain-containing protein [Candidatus Bathyarchaeota archaeon]|nr:VTT domain-containing protein [Candidatus Bathyarchaeota archaeon]
MFSDLISLFIEAISSLGYLGLFIVMFSIGSWAPVPWEPVLLAAGASKLNPLLSCLVCSLASSLGAMLDYLLGLRLRGVRLILNYCSTFWFKKAEAWIAEQGPLACVAARAIPYVPYKTFSLVSGLLRTPFISYTVSTIAGTTVRCCMLIIPGRVFSAYKVGLMSLILVSLAVSALLQLWNRRSGRCRVGKV